MGKVYRCEQERDEVVRHVLERNNDFTDGKRVASLFGLLDEEMLP